MASKHINLIARVCVLMVGARWIFNSKSYDFWLNTMVRKFLLC